jgi:hypothetical protein
MRRLFHVIYKLVGITEQPLRQKLVEPQWRINGTIRQAIEELELYLKENPNE